MVTSPAALPALRAGKVPLDDPQAAFGEAEMAFPPVVGPIRSMLNGESLTLGGTTFVAHTTPGHTPGGLTWSCSSCEGDSCVGVAYADSLNPVSTDGFRYSDDPARVTSFHASIDRVEHLRCDVLAPVHPSSWGLFERAERAATEGTRAFVDPGACRAYAAEARRKLRAQVGREASDVARVRPGG